MAFITLDIEAQRVESLDRVMTDIILSTQVNDEQRKCTECNYEYFGHDHNTDYEKCTVCGHFREVE